MKNLMLAVAAAALPIALSAAPVSCTSFLGGSAPDNGGIIFAFGGDSAVMGGTTADSGCTIADKRYYGFQNLGPVTYNSVNYGATPTNIRISPFHQVVNGTDVYTLSTTGNLQNNFAFQYWVEVYPTSNGNLIDTLSGDISVTHGSNASLTKVATAYDANGNLLGASFGVTASGSTPVPAPVAVPGGAVRLLIQDYYNRGGTGAATGFNNGVTESGRPPNSTPEPATTALMGLGLVGLGMLSRRKLKA